MNWIWTETTEEQARTLLKEGTGRNTAADNGWTRHGHWPADHAPHWIRKPKNKSQRKWQKVKKKRAKKSDEHSLFLRDYLLGNISEREAWNRDAKIEKRAAALQTTTTTAGGYTIPAGMDEKTSYRQCWSMAGFTQIQKYSRTPSGKWPGASKINDPQLTKLSGKSIYWSRRWRVQCSTCFRSTDIQSVQMDFGKHSRSYELLQDADITPVLEDIILTAMGRERMSWFKRRKGPYRRRGQQLFRVL